MATDRYSSIMDYCEKMSITAWRGENLLGYTLMQVRGALLSTRTF